MIDVNESYVIITGFTENSNGKKAGLKIGDKILSYDGKMITSHKDLSDAIQSNESEKAKLIVQRADRSIELSIPKGLLGIYLQTVNQDHAIDDDAVIINGVDEVGWGIGMENTMLGCITQIQKKYGEEIPYADLLGMSGYGFRFHFFDGFCPSSPDGSVGFDCGTYLLENLGYKIEYYHLEEMCREEEDVNKCNQKEMLNKIIESIDQGNPILAVDLIQIPEWGIITGYQKEGKELFCRTYFDQTKGYEIATKFPWLIGVIENYKPFDYKPMIPKSLEIAQTLYETENYGPYFSGLQGIEKWIKALLNDAFFEKLKLEKEQEVKLANWWIFYSWKEAKYQAINYLKKHKKDFNRDPEIINEMMENYQQQAAILDQFFPQIPSPHVPDSPSLNNEIRMKQVEILRKVLNLEESFLNLLKSKR